MALVWFNFFFLLGDVRLADGGAPNQGRVEIFNNGSWTAICGHWFSYDEARVVCRMLWLPDVYTVYSDNPFGAGKNASLLTEQYDCNGHESTLLNCAKRSVSSYCSYYSKNVGITCGPLVVSGEWLWDISHITNITTALSKKTKKEEGKQSETHFSSLVLVRKTFESF